MSSHPRAPQGCFPVGASVALLCLGIFWSTESAHAQVSGVVLDGSSYEPIAGALVTLQATGIRAVAAEDGSFVLGVEGSDLVIVGARPGYYNGSAVVSTPATGVEILLDSVPVAKNRDYEFVLPAGCGACHPDQRSQWTGSPMAKAGSNTWVYDTFDGSGTPGGSGGFVYTRDSRFADSNPESECASCHQPEPWIRDPFRALEDLGSLSQEALHGISCEVCHKMSHIDASRPNFPGIYPGVVSMTLPDGPPYEQVQYGVFGDASFHFPGMMRPSYQPQLVAEVCAACHQDKNDPDEDGDFEEANGVISEPTYVEWLESPYGDPLSSHYATCVDCHMPSYGATKACVFEDAPTRDPETIRGHRIEGTTAVFLDRAVDLDLLYTVADGEVTAEVQITNSGTGHHVPTGVTVRNVILLVEAWTEENGQPLLYTGEQTIHGLGGIGDPALGYYGSLPGKLFAKVNHDSSGASPTFFTDATGIVFDTRIPALATDTTHYAFALPETDGAVHLRARLLYRRAWRALVDAKGWTEDGHGNPLKDIGSDYGHVMAEQEYVFVPSGVDEDAPSIAEGLSIEPNPVTRTATVRFGLPFADAVRLDVLDANGRRVAGLVEDSRTAGEHSLRFEPRDDRGRALSNGIYFLRLRTSRHEAVRRLVVLRQ